MGDDYRGGNPLDYPDIPATPNPAPSDDPPVWITNFVISVVMLLGLAVLVSPVVWAIVAIYSRIF